MSKEAALRAMREARYAARSTGGTPATRPARAPVAPDARPPAARSAEAPSTEAASAESRPPAEDGRCGHRSMNGRTCTREQGHAAKSHRYS